MLSCSITTLRVAPASVTRNRPMQTTRAQRLHLAFTEPAFRATVDMELGMAVETQMEWTMKIVSTLATTALLALAIPALAQTSTAPKSGTTKMSQAECTAAWNKLDTPKSGSVSQSQAQGVVSRRPTPTMTASSARPNLWQHETKVS